MVSGKDGRILDFFGRKFGEQLHLRDVGPGRISEGVFAGESSMAKKKLGSILRQKMKL